MSIGKQNQKLSKTVIEQNNYMDDTQVEYFKGKLLKWRNELEVESQLTVNNLREENWNESDLNDRASVETEASLELKSRDRYRKLMSKIDDALKRIDDGSYGDCDETFRCKACSYAFD